MKKLTVILLFFFSNIIFAQKNVSVALSEPNVEKNALVETLVLEEQQKGSCVIIGTVIDQSSREPIASAKVSILGTKYSTITSDDGQYKIESIPEGIYQIKAEASGYEPQIISNASLLEGKTMDTRFFALQQIQVEPSDFVAAEIQPRPIKENMTVPVYPEIARRAGIEGTVWIKLWVDTDGTPRNAVILKSDVEIFNKPSLAAAMQWKFEPAMLKGKPVAVWVSIPFKFQEYFKGSDLDKLPKVIKSESPKYPESARKNNFEGEFWLNVSIDEKGNVLGAYIHRLHVMDNQTIDDTLSEELKAKLSARAYASVNEMSDEAVNAVKQWKFSPGIKDKNAVKTRLIIPIKFSLNTQKKK